jgi:hypothetical protein
VNTISPELIDMQMRCIVAIVIASGLFGWFAGTYFSWFFFGWIDWIYKSQDVRGETMDEAAQRRLSRWP